MQKNTENRIRLHNLAITLITGLGLFVVAWLYTVPVLRISVMTAEPPFVVKRKLKPLTEYLESKIGMKVEFRPMKDGDMLVEALLANKLDMVWIDDPHLTQARDHSNYGVMAIAQLADGKPAASGSAPSNQVYSWTVRTDMDAALRQKLADVFLTMHQDSGKGSEFMLYQHISRYVPPRAEDALAIKPEMQRAEAAPELR
jgi:ABC-type phosphate/phosphonate transport system substrate-binding protein